MSRKAKQFIDRLRIYVKSGAGSPGNPLIRGKGGNGGSVYLRSAEDCSLTDIVSKHPKKRFIVCLQINYLFSNYFRRVLDIPVVLGVPYALV